MTLSPFLVLRNSKFSLTTPFNCFCSRIRLTADVRTIGGGRPGLAGAAASHGVASVLVESVSMSDALSGAKKFRVATSLEGRVYGDPRYFLWSWSSLICTVPLAPPDVFEAILLGGSGLRCLRLACWIALLQHGQFSYSLISFRHRPRTENTSPLLLYVADHTENTFPLPLRDVTAHALTCTLSRCLEMRRNIITIYINLDHSWTCNHYKNIVFTIAIEEYCLSIWEYRGKF
jgi:hypothetical protein